MTSSEARVWSCKLRSLSDAGSSRKKASMRSLMRAHRSGKGSGALETRGDAGTSTSRALESPAVMAQRQQTRHETQDGDGVMWRLQRADWWLSGHDAGQPAWCRRPAAAEVQGGARRLSLSISASLVSAGCGGGDSFRVRATVVHSGLARRVRHPLWRNHHTLDRACTSSPPGRSKAAHNGRASPL
jgi:hypothetical protein